MEKDNWDDYGFETTFKAAIYDKEKIRVYIGEIKIYQRGTKTTKLKEKFTTLEDEYCSLWQEIEAYKVINHLDFGKELLTRLNDLTYNEILRSSFGELSGVVSSLRRFSDAEKAYLEGYKILNNESDKSNFTFHYIENENSHTPFGQFRLLFSRELSGIYRNIGIIGRNGVGKTTLMANLAIILSGVKKSNARLSPRPAFSKIIAISYSTFDDFYRPSLSERTFSYSYCGIRGKNDLLNQMEINSLFEKSYKKILKLDRISFWNDCIDILFLNQRNNYFNNNDIIKSFKELSSGQKIMTLSFTQIIATITENSLLLFDEPENHLHPNGQNTLFKCLDYILTKFDSFSIISTHSPIFIQNIPRQNVFKITSTNGIRNISNLNIETFGQHFSRLTEEIFGFSENNLFYIEKIKKIVSTEQLNESSNIEDDSKTEMILELSEMQSPGVKFNLENILNDKF
ncbi:AAA family ATPase [Chryseobacterium cucumeris]|uniref:AAA family ATPase n=1 Tax=Chryseobacterium cucumeris TaxID=1813611 RepID=UPI00192D804F|nr:AAA family ATPase [Chryseobacterium cucumeris]QRA41254.1 AAA family ATPase [Chryseobacterium cucumeris]